MAGHPEPHTPAPVKRPARAAGSLAIVALGLGVCWMGVQAMLTYAGRSEPFGFIVGVLVAGCGLFIVAAGADGTR